MDLQAFNQSIKKHKILSCIIKQDDEVIYTHYSNRKMRTSLQTINSITKTVVGLLVGIAHQEGLILSIDVPLKDYFPKYDYIFIDEQKAKITVRHLLTMTDGFDWPEFGQWDFFAPMVFQTDITKFILSRPMLHEPGEVMNYNSGASHLLGVILQDVTKMTMHAYAQAKLFGPLGINHTHWIEKQGISLGSDGLRITTDDLSKIGNLLLNRGVYNNKQLIEASWIDLMATKNKKTYPTVGYYGHHLWCDTYKGIDFHFGLGYGGQYLMVVPKHQLTITLTSRLYKDSMLPLRLIKRHIFDELNRKRGCKELNLRNRV